MNTYASIRPRIKTGDVFLVEGKGLVGKMIRVLTAQQYSHVAMCAWIDAGLWVAEMREGVGFQMQPASQWMAQNKYQCYWGEAPESVHAVPDVIIDFVMKSRAENLSYSYVTLLLVWLSQILGRPLPVGNVCSTWVAAAWKMAGVAMGKSPDPGDFGPMLKNGAVPIARGGHE